MKELEKELEFLDIQENYITNDHKRLKRELIRSKEELKRIQANPLSISSFVEMVDENYALISSNNGTTFFVRVMSILDRE
jgi:26S proteasome regulatory subunit T3